MAREAPRAARAIATAYALATATAVLLLLFSRHGRRPSLVELAFGLVNVPVAPSLLSIVVLALTARALLARKRIGLLIAAGFQVVGIVIGVIALLPRPALGWFELWQSRTDFGRALDTAAVLTGVAALWWMWRLRGAFPGRLRVRHAGGAVVTAVIGTVLTLGVAVALTEATETDGATPATVVQAVLTAIGGTTRTGPQGPSLWIVHVIATLAAATLLASAVVLLRPSQPSPTWTPDRELEIRALLQRHGAGDSLGYLATRRDKDATFSPDRRAVVTHRVVAGVSLASADPVGDRDAWVPAIRAWLARSREQGWTPAVISASEAGAEAYATAGLRVGRMGDEALLDVATWDLGRPSMQPVVRAVQHARRAGLTVTHVRQEELEPAVLAEVTDRAEQWRGGEPDRGFSMALNRAGDPADGRILHTLARDGEGRLVGLLSFVPWGPAGVSLDVMRRSPDAPNGVTELMIADLMAQARALGVQRVSLNFCMFRDTFEGAQLVTAGSPIRALAWVLGRLDRFWQLERLYRFNLRFDPTWAARFHAYDDPASLPQVALAAGMAEGFVPAWRRPEGKPGLDATHLARARALDELPAGAPGPAPALTQQERERRRRAAAMGAAGMDAYPVGAGEPADTVPGLVTHWADGTAVEVVARVRSVRDHGGVLFVTLVEDAARVQALLDEMGAGRVAMEQFRRFADTGDLLRVRGRLGRSRNGTPSLLVHEWRMEAKALRPVPFTGLEAPRVRLRDRSGDLLVHPGQRQLLRQRSAVVAAVRQVLHDEGYLEVETPILQAVHGGATARPFETWSNAYGLDLSLRIAPELYLKRLLTGGLGPVFEIGRNFRNEGADATHNPEFTALEAYRPHADYTTMRTLTERIVRAAAVAVHGIPAIPVPDRSRVRQGLDGIPMVDVSGPWAVVPVLDAVSAAAGATITVDTDPAVLHRISVEHGLGLSPRSGPGAIIEALYAELVEPTTTSPTFYVDFPAETSPLTRPHRSAPGLAERWDLVIAGMEVGTAYSELADPIEQRTRLTDQSRLAAAGDPEAMQVDEDFLRALELGMPPAGGLGLGIDRLVMLLTNTPIRSVLPFPFVRPDRARAGGSVPDEEPPWT